MKSDKSKEKTSTEAKKEAEQKVHADFKHFGKILIEDLNNYFDVDIMSAARRRRRKRFRR